MNTTNKVVSYKGYTVEVSEASTLQGMKRQTLRSLAVSLNQGEADTDIRVLRILLYPDLVSATVKAEGFTAWPISFEEFKDLPERLTNKWEEAVYGLNPHWLPDFSEDEQKKKDEEQPTN